MLSERPLVLLVEDDRDGRMILAEWLEGPASASTRPITVFRPSNARSISLPDAILTDLNIPGIDGYELTRRAEERPAHQRDSRAGRDRLRAFPGSRARRSRRVRRVLHKPCDPDELGRDPDGADHGGPRPPARLTPRCLPS